MVRPHELRFAATEVLFRQVAHYQIRNNCIKPSALRLQISVARSKYESATEVQERARRKAPLYDGVMQIDVQQIRQCGHGHVQVSCIDDPTEQIPSHALIAMWTEASPDHTIDEDLEYVRVLLAREMRLKLPPRTDSR